MHAASTLKVDQPLCGLLVDEWVEVVPSAKETTAVAFQFNPPDACAPQSVLLAVPPVPDQPWTVASLHRVLVETLDLAKLRAVDAEALGEIGHYMPALYLRLQHQRRSRLDRLRAADEIAHGQTTSRRPGEPGDPRDPGPIDPEEPEDPRDPRPPPPPPPPPPPLPPEGANPSITSWTRLEVRSRQADMRASLSARVFDPLWLMARQWQVGEFQGEDAGMPVLARVRSQTTMLSRIHLGELPANTITQAAAYDPQRCRSK